ncbi:hypothetical protein T08_3741, partial [Trichinella sp. T8]
MELYSALSNAYASFLFLLLLLKLHYIQRLLQYLGKYAFIGFWKVSMQTNRLHAPMLIHRKAAKLILSRNSANMLEFFFLYYKIDIQSVCFISFPVAPTKITLHSTFITISRQIRIYVTGFWKVSMQTNRYLLSKLPLKFACAY